MRLHTISRSTAVVAAAVLSLLVLTGCNRSSDPERVMSESRALIASGKSGEAHVRLKKLLSEGVSVPGARVLLARIALDSGDIRGADSELTALTPAQLEEPEALVVRAWVDLGLGRHEKVLATLDSTRAQIRLVERARLRASALRMSGAGADAFPILREAIAAEPNDGRVVVELAATLGAIGNLSQAQRELDEFLKTHPNDADALHARGELRLRGGATATAIADLEASLAAAPSSWPLVKQVTAELSLGDARLAAGDLENAKEVVASLEKRYPGSLATQLLIARVALAEGRSGDAADTLQRITDAMPADQRVQSLLIDALLRSGNKARATALLERRVQQNPSDARARRLLAELLMQQSRPDRVVALLGDVQELPGQYEQQQDHLLSAARLAQDRAGAAITTLESQLSGEPDNELVRAELAAAYLQNGQATRGLTTLDAGRATSPTAIGVRLALNFALANDREVNTIVTSLLDAPDTNVETLIAAADAAQRAGRNDVLARLIDRALEREPKNANALIRRANFDFVEARYDRAATALETLIQIDPQDARPRIAMARVSEAKGDVAGARSSLSAAIKANPQAIEPALMLASLELRAQQPQAAAEVIDNMIANTPTNGVAANAAGAILLSARRAEEARARFGQAIEQNGTNARYHFNLARAQLLAEDRAAAAQSFQQAAKLQPEWVDANIAAVRLALELKQNAAAEAVAQSMVERLPKEPRSWLLLGDTQMVAGRAADAAGSFAKSYALHASAQAALREHLARVANATDRSDQPLLNWLAREPNDLPVRRRLADFYQQSGTAKAATEQLEIIVKAAPNDVASLNNLAWLLADSNTQRAESLARRATAIMPQQPAMADTLGWVLIKAGKYPEAAEVLKRAAIGMPKDRSVRYRYALAAAKAGDKATARQELQTVLADGAIFDSRDAAQQLSQELGS
jgi:putative PEP-CTERM system TPR-repeat lipoprotein